MHLEGKLEQAQRWIDNPTVDDSGVGELNSHPPFLPSSQHPYLSLTLLYIFQMSDQFPQVCDANVMFYALLYYLLT